VNKRIRSREFVTLRAAGGRTGGRDVRDKWTKLRRGKPRSRLGKVVEQVDSQAGDDFERRCCRQKRCSEELEPAGHGRPKRKRVRRELA
jgi:hypothetical protein